MCVSRSSGFGEVAQADELFEDLAGGQIAVDAVEPAGAEDTAHAAADLRADAGRVAVGFLNEDALDVVAVVQAEDEFVGAVGGGGVPRDRGGEGDEVGRQRYTQRERQVRHLLECLGAALEQPAAKLPPAHGPLLVRVEPGVRSSGDTSSTARRSGGDRFSEVDPVILLL